MERRGGKAATILWIFPPTCSSVQTMNVFLALNKAGNHSPNDSQVFTGVVHGRDTAEGSLLKEFLVNGGQRIRGKGLCCWDGW